MGLQENSVTFYYNLTSDGLFSGAGLDPMIRTTTRGLGSYSAIPSYPALMPSPWPRLRRSRYGGRPG